MMPNHCVGDIVQIVSEPNLCAPCGWWGGMNKYCGMEARITRVAPNGYYDIDIDMGESWWSDDCFVEQYIELPDLDPIPPEALSELYG